MKVKQVLLAVLNIIFRLSLSCIIVVIIYEMAMYAYNFGYMVFADAAVEASPGRDITITVEMGDDVRDIGATLENRGLIADANIFWVQAYLLDYKDKMQPGEYTLNTSMKADEMMLILSASVTEDEEGESEEAGARESGAETGENTEGVQ